MSGRVVLQNQSGAVGVQSVVLFENGGRNRTRRRGRKCVVPAFDARVFQKDACAFSCARMLAPALWTQSLPPV